MGLRSILSHPLTYQAYQKSGGFFGARLRAIDKYLGLSGTEKIIDVGCGPGFIVKYLPAGVDYHGFDTDEKYIAYARSRFGGRARFSCQPFDAAQARACSPVDVLMLNGVLHHLDDDTAHSVLACAREVLGDRGRLFTLDGCYADDQPSVARLLLKYDRGEYVRTAEQYRALLAEHFPVVTVNVDGGLSWVPYTWIVMIAHDDMAKRHAQD